MVFAVGLTGNIASGKTTAADFFAKMGIEVISADAISKDLTLKDSIAYQHIVKHFGDQVLLNNGALNRALIRDLIFKDPKARVWLEQLLHPLIRQELERRVQLSTTPYCVVEIPLLYDKKHYPYLNKILVITTSLEHQIARVMDRDHCSKEQALAIINTQPPTSTHLAIADDVVTNESGLEALEHALLLIHERYLNNSIAIN